MDAKDQEFWLAKAKAEAFDILCRDLDDVRLGLTDLDTVQRRSIELERRIGEGDERIAYAG